MPGKNGSEIYIVGEPSAPKPVNVGPCAVCGHDCYRQTFRVGKGWRYLHYGCEPDQPRIERHHKKGKIPMGYVPRGYEDVSPKGPTASEFEGWKPRDGSNR